MKKRMMAVMAAAVLLITLSACGTDSSASGGQSDAEILAYITAFDVGNVTVDIVEWVDVPGRRADELGLKASDYPSGFYVYNPDTLENHFNVSADCVITILDWENSYEPLKVSAEEFTAVLQERGAINAQIPYLIKIADGMAVEMTEHYIP